MAKLTLSDLANLQNEATAVSTLNNNNALLEAALENTVSRDGTSPNSMSGPLDMNGQQITNLPFPSSPTAPVRFQDAFALADASTLSRPGTTTDNAIVRWNGTTGSSIQDAVVLVGDTGAITGVSTLTASGGITGTTLTGTSVVSSGAISGTTITGTTLTGTSVVSSGAISGTTITGTTLTGTSVQPTANDVGALGAGAVSWSDLFLASGGVINFNNGNLTLIHSSGQITLNGGLRSSSATGGLGYSTGSGGTVTQATSKATGVTLNTITGEIIMNAASLAATTTVGFTLTNSNIAATDLVVLNIKSGGAALSYLYAVRATAAGSCVIELRNVTAGALAEAVVLSFAIIKGVIS